MTRYNSLSIGDRVTVNAQYADPALYGLEGTVVHLDPNGNLWPVGVKLDETPYAILDNQFGGMEYYNFDAHELDLFDEDYPLEVPD